MGIQCHRRVHASTALARPFRQHHRHDMGLLRSKSMVCHGMRCRYHLLLHALDPPGAFSTVSQDHGQHEPIDSKRDGRSDWAEYQAQHLHWAYDERDQRPHDFQSQPLEKAAKE
jgi:hypothetical protein